LEQASKQGGYGKASVLRKAFTPSPGSGVAGVKKETAGIIGFIPAVPIVIQSMRAEKSALSYSELEFHQ
jgi:hypothetical protein